MNSTLSASILFIFALLGFSEPQGLSNSAKPGSANGKEASAPLKAVLVVGPLQDGTTAAIESMNEIAEILKTNGVTVHRFYDTNADWEKIKTASQGASFFVYSGHGSTIGEGGKTGGLCLKTMIPSKKIIEGLQLQNNALVIFKSVCRGAGSSASDNGDIGIKEALERVGDYAQPFFKTGAVCYYANNLGDGCVDFLSDFFSGKTVKVCFEESAKPWAKIEVSKKCPFDQSKEIGIASTEWEGTTTRTTYTNGVKSVEEIPSSKQYDIAYVGEPNFSIKDLMK